MRSNEFYRRPNRPRTTRIHNEMDRSFTVYEQACGLYRQTMCRSNLVAHS